MSSPRNPNDGSTGSNQPNDGSTGSNQPNDRSEGMDNYDPFNYRREGESNAAPQNQPGQQGDFRSEYDPILPWENHPNAPGWGSAPMPGGTEMPVSGVGSGVAMPGGELPPEAPVVSGPTQPSIGEAFSASLTHLNRSLGSWIGGTVILYLLPVAAFVMFLVSMAGTFERLEDASEPTLTGPEMMGLSWGLLFGMVLLVLFQLFLIRGAFETVDGRKFRLSSLFRINRWGAVLGAMVLSFIIQMIAVLPAALLIVTPVAILDPAATAVGPRLVMGYLIGLVLAIAVQPIVSFMLPLVMDGRATALDSPAIAWREVKPVYWKALLAIIIVTVVNQAGALLFYIGLLYTTPLSTIILIHFYRQVVGGRRVLNQ